MFDIFSLTKLGPLTYVSDANFAMANAKDKDMTKIKGAALLWRRVSANMGRVVMTLVIVGGAIFAGVAGHRVLSVRAAQTNGPESAPLTAVTPMVIQMQDTLTIPRRFSGQFEAAQETTLSFEEGGTIYDILVREGDRVAQGDVIAAIDTRLLQAERARLLATRAVLEAETDLAQRTDERQRALLADGHVTQQRVDETSLQLAGLEASVAEIDARLAAVDVRLSKAQILAPFAGEIGTRLLDVGAVAGPGTPVVTLLESGPSRFRVGIDPILAAQLDTGAEAEIQIGTIRHTARLAYLAPELDAATRARIAFFDVMADVAPPSRTAGELTLTETIETTGAWVPLTALRQGPRGTWVLLTVQDGDMGERDTGEDTPPIVALEAAEILHLDRDRAFVRGSFVDGALILPSGTHRVVPGEFVRLIHTDAGIGGPE